MSDLPPAGWNDDPDDPTQYRYWDGRNWTDHRAPKSGDALASAPAEGRPLWRSPWFIGAAVLVLIVLAASLGQNDVEDEPVAAPSPAATAAVEPEPEPEETPRYSPGCGRAMARAAAVDDMQDTGEETNPAFHACETLEEFSAASADHPAALDGVDPETYVTNRCQFVEEVQGSDLCVEVVGG